MRLGNIEHKDNNEGIGSLMIEPLTVAQWSMLAVCLFFCTGHWFVVYSSSAVSIFLAFSFPMALCCFQ